MTLALRLRWSVMQFARGARMRLDRKRARRCARAASERRGELEISRLAFQEIHN
jgi:hypothetical protein